MTRRGGRRREDRLFCGRHRHHDNPELLRTVAMATERLGMAPLQWAGQDARSCSMAKLRAPDDRGVTHIDDLQDAIAGHRPARARPRPGWQGPALAPSGDPALISLPGPAWLGA